MNTALESIKLLPKQIEQVWQEIDCLNLLKTHRDQALIAISGMGGSIYNYYFLESVFKDTLLRPLLKINNYLLPKCVGDNSLFIASSYSGTTEEVLFNTKQALARKAKVLVFSAGGPLIDLAKKHSLPYYRFEPKHNPSTQPRMGQGYMLFGALGLLNKLGYLSEQPDLDFLSDLKNQATSYHQQVKKIIAKLAGQELFFVGADHLSANAHILRNQTNETAKLYANYNLLPELNHHLMEGLKHPNNRNRIFIFLNSDLYQKRNQQRLKLTKEVIVKNGYQIVEFMPKSSNKLAQFVETLIWGGYLTYELGKKYGEDPNKIPWVDYFKNNLPKI